MLLILTFTIALIFASLVEYWLHRWMHIDPRLGGEIIPHYEHHRENTTSGVLREFKDYVLVVPLSFVAFFISLPVGIAAVLGSLVGLVQN